MGSTDDDMFVQPINGDVHVALLMSAQIFLSTDDGAKPLEIESQSIYTIYDI